MADGKRNRADNFLDVASALTASATVPECERIFADALLPFEIDVFACGELSLSTPDRGAMLVVHWPPAWRKFYLEEGLIGRDPILSALAHRKAPFTWSDLRADRTISAMGTQALREIAAHGWTEGLVIPIPRSPDRLGLVSLAGKRGPFDGEEIRFLSALSFLFHERVRGLAPICGVAVAPSGLTARETEALSCVASGRDDAEIAIQMGVGKTTAHEFVEKAKRKLKAANRSQAVALAVSMGLISP